MVFHGKNIKIFQIADNVDYTELLPMPLYPRKLDLRLRESLPAVCGWSGNKGHESEENDIENAKYSNNLLKCMRVKILPRKICTPTIPPGDFKESLMCGQGDMQQMISVVITLHYKIDVFCYFREN